MIRCVCLVCDAEWTVERVTDDGPDGHEYGARCPHMGPPRPVFIPAAPEREP